MILSAAVFAHSHTGESDVFSTSPIHCTVYMYVLKHGNNLRCSPLTKENKHIFSLQLSAGAENKLKPDVESKMYDNHIYSYEFSLHAGKLLLCYSSVMLCLYCLY